MYNLYEYFEYIINILNTDIKTDSLSKIDKFCILLTLRIVCIGSEVDLQFKCKKTGQKYTGSIELNNILQMMVALECNRYNHVKISDDVSVRLTVPSSLYVSGNNVVEIITDCVNYIKINNQGYNLAELSSDERKDIINKLPGNLFNDIILFANKTQDKFKDFIIFTDKNPHNPDDIEQDHKLNLYDNSMFEFIKLCFTESLEGFYHMMYSLCSDVNMSANYIEKCTPAETIMFLNFRKMEVATQNEAMKKQSNPTSSSGPVLPNRIPDPVENM